MAAKGVHGRSTRAPAQPDLYRFIQPFSRARGTPICAVGLETEGLRVAFVTPAAPIVLKGLPERLKLSSPGWDL